MERFMQIAKICLIIFLGNDLLGIGIVKIRLLNLVELKSNFRKTKRGIILNLNINL